MGDGSLAGSGAESTLVVTPTSKDFGSVTVGSDSAAQPFTLTNTGSATAGPIGVTLSGPDASQFLIASTTCSAATLPAGGRSEERRVGQERRSRGEAGDG